MERRDTIRERCAALAQRTAPWQQHRRMVTQRRRWRYGHGSLVCSAHLGTLVGEEGQKRRTMMGGRGMALTPCHPC